MFDLRRPPLVSAVIPSHNGGKYLDAAIRSVLRQSWPAVECIVVDDGSDDETAAIARSTHPSVHVLTLPRRGVAAARNAGIQAASGELIGFLDADDVWLPQKIENQMRALTAAPGAVGAFAGYAITDARLNPVRIILHSGRPHARPVDRALLVEGPGLGFSFTGLVRRAALDRAGGFREHLSTSADIDLAWRLSQHGALVGVREVLALHRRHAHDQMHRDVPRVAREMTIVLRDAGAAGMPAPAVARGLANLQIYCAVTCLGRGEVARGLSALAAAMLRAPHRTASRIAAAGVGRATEHARVLRYRRSDDVSGVLDLRPGLVQAR